MKVLLDTNVLYNYLVETSLTGIAKELLKSKDEFYVSTLVLNELYYAVLRRSAEKRFHICSYRKLKEFLNKNGYEPFVEEFSKVDTALEVLGIQLIPDSQNWTLIRKLMLKYNLLPNDATILATCIDSGMDALATFDEDYRKVQELKIIP